MPRGEVWPGEEPGDTDNCGWACWGIARPRRRLLVCGIASGCGDVGPGPGEEGEGVSPQRSLRPAGRRTVGVPLASAGVWEK